MTMKINVHENKKSEAVADFKVGDFVNYDAEKDGGKLIHEMAFAEVIAVNEDGTLKLQPYDQEDFDEVDGADPQCCRKMEHFAGMTDASTYYMDGKFNVYKGYYEIIVTDKDLGRPYSFAGTIDSLDEVEELWCYYDEVVVFDQDIKDDVMRELFGGSDDDSGITFAEFTDKVETAESKKSEAEGDKDVFTIDLFRIDADGEEDRIDDMAASQTYYSDDDAIEDAKKIIDGYKDDDGVVFAVVMAGEREKPSGDIVGEPFDIYWASSSDKATTSEYRKKANYAAFDNAMDYYAK